MAMKRFCDTCDDEIEDKEIFFFIEVKRSDKRYWSPGMSPCSGNSVPDRFEVCSGCAMQIPLRFKKEIPEPKQEPSCPNLRQ